MIVGITGHRPPKAELTWSHESEGDLLAVDLTRAYLKELKPRYVIAGGALGYDTLAARAAWLEKIPYHVYVPFRGQEERWPYEARRRYHDMLMAATEVFEISVPGYKAIKMHTRNHAMVDAADVMLAYWDGSRGGTYSCLSYAERKGVEYDNLYEGIKS